MKVNNSSLNLNSYFDSISNCYSVNEHASLYTTNLMRKLALKHIKDYSNKSVLDLMSGTGENIRLLKDINKIKHISTLDFSSNMNCIAKKKISHINFEQIEDDFFKTKQLKTYDIILCTFGVKTFTETSIKIFCKKISTILNPNGEIVILELVKPKSDILSFSLKFYLNHIIARIFSKKFRLLFPFIEANKNLDIFKTNILANNITIQKHKRKFFIYEIIHAKKSFS